MTQTSRVLAAARSYRGTCQADWLDETPDGGPRITRVAARLQDLEDTGHVFECIGWRNKTKVFRVLSEPDPEQASDSSSSAVAGLLSAERDVERVTGKPQLAPVSADGPLSADPGPEPTAGVSSVRPSPRGGTGASGGLSAERLFEAPVEPEPHWRAV